MYITAVFINDPFSQELRIDCNKLKIKTVKDGEICILPNFNDSIFEVEDTCIDVITNESVRKIKVINSGIIKYKNNTLTYFGNFKESEST